MVTNHGANDQTHNISNSCVQGNKMYTHQVIEKLNTNCLIKVCFFGSHISNKFCFPIFVFHNYINCLDITVFQPSLSHNIHVYITSSSSVYGMQRPHRSPVYYMLYQAKYLCALCHNLLILLFKSVFTNNFRQFSILESPIQVLFLIRRAILCIFHLFVLFSITFKIARDYTMPYVLYINSTYQF